MMYELTNTDRDAGTAWNWAGVLDGIAVWSEALQGGRTIGSGLDAICRGLGTEHASLSRFDLEDDEKPVSVACYRSSASERRSMPSMLEQVMGNYLTHGRAGSVWIASAVSGPTTALQNFRKTFRIEESVVVPLGQTGKVRDFLELHFSNKLDEPLNGILNTVGPLLAGTWGRRVPGLMSLAAASERPTRADGQSAQSPVLDYSNPYRLTRAEYRVCLLLSRGLSNASLSRELDISETTLRTHLRSVYAKTGIQTRADLVGRLIRDGQQQGATILRFTA